MLAFKRNAPGYPNTAVAARRLLTAIQIEELHLVQIVIVGVTTPIGNTAEPRLTDESFLACKEEKPC